MAAIVRAVASARIPLAGSTAAMVVVLEAVLPVEAIDQALLRTEAHAADTPARWDDAAWGDLETATVVLTDEAPVIERAAAAAAEGQWRGDVTFVPVDANVLASARALTSDPALARLWRDIVLFGSPAEASVSALAAARPVAATCSTRWGFALDRHLVPLTLLEGVAPEPRGASDRRRALDDTAPLRARLAAALAGDAELSGAAASLMRARAATFSGLAERDLADRTAADVAAFERAALR
jgi:hypothetical protein